MSITTERIEELISQAKGSPLSEAPGSIRDIITQLLENLANIDAAEAEAILAKILEATADFASGRWILGMVALAAALRLYRQAIVNSPLPAPVS